MSSVNKPSKDKYTIRNPSKESSKGNKTNDNTGITDAEGEKSGDNTGTTDPHDEISKTPTIIRAEDYDRFSSDDEDIFYCPEDAITVNQEDDYPEEQDRLQIQSIDKNVFREQETSLLTDPNPKAGDTPSLRQINKPIQTDEKQPQRDRRYNRKTASDLNETEQSKHYNAWISRNQTQLKAITIEDLKKLHTDLAPIQEISLYQYVKNVIQAMFSAEVKVRFGMAIQDLPLRGRFNLCLDPNRRLTLKWHKMSIYQLRNLIEMLFKQMERSASQTTSVSQQPKEVLQELVKNQMIQILKLENSQVLKEDEFNKLKTDFLIELMKNTSAAALYALPETQTSLTQYAHDFLRYKAKSCPGVVSTRVTQLTTILDKSWYNGSQGIYKTYDAFQQNLYTVIENLRANLKAVLSYAHPSYEEATKMSSRDLKDTLIQKNNRTSQKVNNTVIGSLKRKINPFTGQPLYDGQGDPPPPPKHIKTEHRSPNPKDTKTEIKSPPAPLSACNHCGGVHRSSTATCPFVLFKHPHVNYDKNIPWINSKHYEMYKANPWESKHGTQMRLRHDHTLVHNAESNSYHWQDKIGMPSAKRTPRGNYISNMSYSTFLAIMFRVKPIDTPLLTFSILPNLSKRYGETTAIPPTKRQRKSTRKKEIDQHDPIIHKANACLIDTGALDCSYISLELAESIQKLGYEIVKNNHDPPVKTPFSQGTLFPTYGKVTFYVKIYNELSNHYESICIHNARIIDSPIEIIIGQPTIYLHNLLEKCKDQILAYTKQQYQANKIINLTAQSKEVSPYHLNNMWLDANAKWYDDELQNCQVQPAITLPKNNLCSAEISGYSRKLEIRKKTPSMLLASLTQGQDGMKKKIHIVEPLPNIRPNQILLKEDLIQYSSDEFSFDDDIHPPEADPIYHSKNNTAKDVYHDTKIGGSQYLKDQLEATLKSLKEVFSYVLPLQPAKVKPLQFDVDKEKWETRANQLPARPQSYLKDKAIEQHVQEMLRASVISQGREEQAWSQCHLVAKPDGSWRMTQDFRNLNQTVKGRPWPLPRIHEMLQRIGNRKPKYFAKIDLTHGYHQMPLAEESQSYTAFKTSFGIYKYRRVPMGILNASGFFQQAMVTEVLHELVENICFVYLDDVFVIGFTEDDFVDNVKNVLQRFKEYNIVVKPSKCEFGMESIEILGHTMDKEGIHFSDTKLDSLSQTALPSTATKLNSFVCLCNYFRDHIRNISEMDKPLRSLAMQYKNGNIPWHSHPEEEKLFYKLRKAVANCPKLFFHNEDYPVFLCTDASDYGIGAYLYQQDPDTGKEYPLGFYSKGLVGAQLKWSTFEKEGYAIHQAIKKFHYLLRDIKFRIQTDHRNLLFVNREASSKVLHWKWDIQEYNFDVQHIPGVENIAADSLSRLCSLYESSNILPDIDPNIIITLQKDIIQDDSIGRPSYMLCFLQEPSLIEAPTSYAI